MPQYKLHYFNAKSRAELIRYIFAVANVEFEDKRLDFMSDWATQKTSYRYQKLPVLELENGVVLTQSIAIAHFLARKFGLSGKTELDDAKCLALAEQTKDLLEFAGNIFWTEKDAAKKQQRSKEYKETVLKVALDGLEADLKENATGYFVGDSLTWADLAVYCSSEILISYIEFSDDILAGHPALKAHREKVGTNEALRAYQAKRPNTPY